MEEPAPPRRRRGRASASATAEEAIATAEKEGQAVETTTDEAGNTFKQRPFSLEESSPKAPAKGARVKVYNKVKATLHLSDGKLGPNEEGYILESDLEHPGVAASVVRLAE